LIKRLEKQNKSPKCNQLIIENNQLKWP